MRPRREPERPEPDQLCVRGERQGEAVVDPTRLDKHIVTGLTSLNLGLCLGFLASGRLEIIPLFFAYFIYSMIITVVSMDKDHINSERWDHIIFPTFLLFSTGLSLFLALKNTDSIMWGVGLMLIQFSFNGVVGAYR
jgi:hypothetical protein